MNERLLTNGHLPDVKVFDADGRLVKVDEAQLAEFGEVVAQGKADIVRLWGSRDPRDRNEYLIERLERFFASSRSTEGRVMVVEEEENSPWLLVVAKR